MAEKMTVTKAVTKSSKSTNSGFPVNAYQLTLTLRPRRKLIKAVVAALEEDAGKTANGFGGSINGHFARCQGVAAAMRSTLAELGYELDDYTLALNEHGGDVRGKRKPIQPTPTRFYVSMPLGDFLIEWLRRLTNGTTTGDKELAAAAQALGLSLNEAVARALVNLSLRWINGEPLTASTEDLVQE